MTTDYQFNDRSSSQPHTDLPDGIDKHTNELTGAINMVKRDRFELLSAYLDGELAAAERKQVEEWLTNDQSVKLLYSRLLKIRQGLHSLPIPQEQAVEETVQKVFVRLRRRTRRAILLGGTAIAACVIGAMSGLLPGNNSPMQQLAQQTAEPTQPKQSVPAISASPLMVAINAPVIPIPKTAEAEPDNSVDNSIREQQGTEEKIN
jgi:anti-sigma factor RsiW